MSKTIALAMSGASGVPYGLRLLECLLKADCRVYLMISQAAKAVFRLEADIELPNHAVKLNEFFLQRYCATPQQLRLFSDKEWTAPVASGSAKTPHAMVVCPCSSSCLSAIAHGNSDNLLERAADVMIKEKRPLILVHREMPLSIIHLENMLKLAKMNVTIIPASPGFYQHPKTIADLVDFVVSRVLDHLQVEHALMPRWGEG